MSTWSIAGLGTRSPSRSWRAPRADDLVGMGQPEGDEQQARLVDVAVVLVDHRDAASGRKALSSRLALSVPPVPPPKSQYGAYAPPNTL